MNIPNIIQRKRNGEEFNADEINFLVKAIAENEAHPAQVGAVLMAIFLKGLNIKETVSLTKAMVHHGECFAWPETWKHLVVDKHSTGGVGDKVSLPLAPVLASLGLKVPMISGRGLGFTGGTLDKLESIPGFNVSFTTEQIFEAVQNVGCCIVGQTSKLVPSDKEMYAIRDVTATVDSTPLIVSSIISKKKAESIAALVLDVKCGVGAFKKNEKDARELAQWLVNTSNGLGVKTTGVLTKMDHPIGLAIGNSVEVIESIECLQGKGPKDLEELVCVQGGYLLASSGKASSPEEGRIIVHKALSDDSGLKKFEEMLIAQGVAKDLASNLCNPQSDLHKILPIGKMTTEFMAEKSGIVSSFKALALAMLLTELGAGRLKPGDKVDHGVGLQLKFHPGQFIKQGEVWGVLYHSTFLTDGQKGALKDAIVIEEGTVADARAIESRIIDIITPSN